MATSEQITKVRAYCYGPTEAQLPDLIIEANIDKWLSIYPALKDEGIALYNATLDCLRYLIFKDAQSGAGTGMRRKEQVGRVMVEIETTESYISPWQKLLDDYLDGNITIPGANIQFAPVIIGGVSKREIWRVTSNPDSNSGLRSGLGVDKRSLYDGYRNSGWRRNR